MTKKEIEVLRMLGMVDTKEDGAILQGSDGVPISFVWEDEKFESVIKRYRAAVAGLHKGWHDAQASVWRMDKAIKENRW